MVEQFAGDGVMVIFGLPRPHPSDAARALACAAGLFREIGALDAAAAGGPVAIRVGAHFGPVSASVLGADRQRHVSVSGDVVNAASRLQELAKAEGAAVAVSEALLAASGDAAGWRDRLGLRPLGPQALRGRAAALEVWVGPPPGAAAGSTAGAAA